MRAGLHAQVVVVATCNLPSMVCAVGGVLTELAGSIRLPLREATTRSISEQVRLRRLVGGSQVAPILCLVNKDDT